MPQTHHSSMGSLEEVSELMLPFQVRQGRLYVPQAVTSMIHAPNKNIHAPFPPSCGGYIDSATSVVATVDSWLSCQTLIVASVQDSSSLPCIVE
jgi:hypothetical protein